MSNSILNTSSLMKAFLFLACALIVACQPPQGAGSGNNGATSSNLTSAQAQANNTAQQTASVNGRLEISEGSALGILVFAEGTSYMAMTDSRGEFELSGMPIGQYNLLASRGGPDPIMIADIIITQEDIQKDQPFLNIGNHDANSIANQTFAGANVGAATIRGSVITARPQDLDGVLVEIAGTQYRTTTDSQGLYTLVNVQSGDYSLRFSQKGYVASNRPITVSDTTAIDVPPVRLSARNLQTIDGRAIVGEIVLLDISGEPMNDFKNVYLTLNKSGQRHFPDADGLFEISGLEANQYLVNINADGFLKARSKIADLSQTELTEISFVLEQDPDQVDLSSLLIGQVLLEEAGEQGNAGVSLTLTGTSYTATSDGIGTFEFNNIEEGTYTLVATFSGYETTYIENIKVPALEIVEIDPFVMPAEINRPVIVSTSPEDGATDVTIEDPTLVQIIFDQPMEPSSVRSAISIRPEVSFNVLTNGQHPLADQDRIVIEMAGFTRGGEVLRFGRRYNVTVNSSASSVEDVSMEEDYKFSFTTGQAKVTGTFPRDNQKSVFINDANPIRVYFNVGLDTDLFDSDDVRIRPEPNVQPNVYVVNERETGWGQLVIGANLDFEEEYEITIRDGIRSLTNDRISNLPYNFSFTTTSQTEGIDYFNSTDDDRDRRRQERERKN